jgi:hypothetical protein
LGGRPGGRSDGRSDGRPKFKKKVRFVKNNTFASDGSGSDGFFHPLDADFRPLDAIHLSLKIKKVALEKKGLGRLDGRRKSSIQWVFKLAD